MPKIPDNIKSAAKALKVDADILHKALEHIKEISSQREDVSIPIKAVKIIMLDEDENWYISQDEPDDDRLWADPFGDDRDSYEEDDIEDDESSDEDDDGGNVPSLSGV